MINNEFFDLYMSDTREHLNAISQNLLSLESEPTNTDYIQSIFRAAHTIKGSSATLELVNITKVTHRLEDLFGAIRDNKIQVCKRVIDVALKALDCLELLHEQIYEESMNVDYQSVVSEIESILSGDAPVVTPKLDCTNAPKPSESTNSTISALIENSMFDKQSVKELLNISANEPFIAEAISSGADTYYIHADVSKDCDYKGVRVFMLYEAICQHGEIITSYPTQSSLESEDFTDTDTHIIFVSNVDESTLAKAFVGTLEIEVTEYSKLAVKKVEEQNSKEEVSLAVENSPNTDASVKVQPKEPAQHRANKESNLYVRVHTKTLDTLMNEEGELLLEYNRLRLVIDKCRRNEMSIGTTLDILDDISGNINKIIGTQQSIIMSTRMFPLEQLFQVFPRMIRDLSSTLGKPVELIINGQDTELDRTILEKVSDPLKHIIRNAIDHGVETPEERLAAGKSEKGHITLSAKQESNSVIITVSDDGKGMDKEVLKKKAVEKGLYTESQVEKLRDDEIFGIIFMPGFSTASQVTEVSGRGVGMDIVKSCLGEIGGVVLIDSKLGEGTTFTVKIPLTLAISQALLVTVEKDKYIILLNYIQEVIEVNRATDIKRIQHKDHIVIRGDKIYPLIYLRDVYGHPVEEHEVEKVILIQNNGREIGLVADDWIGQQDIVVKSLNKYLKDDVKYEAGITKLGDGSIPIIIDVPAIMEDF